MRTHAHAHTCAAEFLFKREGGKQRPRTVGALHPGYRQTSTSCPIAAPSLTAKHHRDATEAERSRQTGPPPCCNPSYPTGTSSCLSLPSFLPSYHLHLLVSAAPHLSLFKKATLVPVVYDRSCNAACLASSARIETASLALELPSSLLLEFLSLLDCFFSLFLSLKWTLMCMCL